MMLTFEESVNIAFEQFDLNMKKVNADFTYAFEMAQLMDSYTSYEMLMYEEVQDDDGEVVEKKDSIITRVINYVKRLIADIKASIRNASMPEEEALTVERWLQSQNGQVQLQYDIAAIEQAANKQMVQGRKMIQRLAQFLPFEDTEIAKFVDTCTNFVIQKGKFIVPVATLGIIRRKCSENVLNGLDKKISDFKAIDPYKPPSEIKAEKKAAKAAKKAEKANADAAKKQKCEQQKMQICNAITKMSKDVGTACSNVYGTIEKTYRSAKQRMNKGGNK